MSLSVALSTALAGLQASQQQLQIISNNVSNAQTPGYSRETAAQVATAIDGVGTGVDVSPVTRTVSQQLINDVNAETSVLNFSQTVSSTLGQAENALGDPNSGDDLGTMISNFATDLQALASTPTSASQKAQTVSDAQSLASSLNTIANQVQTLRAQSDQGITTALQSVNQQLSSIASLNAQITQQQALGQSTASLQDQRDQAVATLSTLMNISTFQRPDGSIAIYTQSGQPLLEGSTAPTLTHSAVGSASSSVTYPGGGITGIMLNGTDITADITGGQIGALIQLRDSTLPAMAQQTDQLAATLGSTLNAIHNSGTSVPPPNQLTSDQTVAGTDAFSGTGTVTIAVVDQNGNAVAAPFQLNLSTLGATTVNGLIGAINTGLGANGSASIVNGQFVIKAANASDGIAINQSGTNIGGAAGPGFSSYFGLNDLFTGLSSSDPAASIAVRSDIQQNPNLLATGTLTTSAVAAGANAVAPSDNSVIQQIANAFNGDASFAAAGGLPAMTTSFTNYAAQIVSGVANQVATAKNQTTYQSNLVQNLTTQAQSVSAVNTNEELTNLTVYQNAYTASARVLSVITAMFQTLDQLGQ